MHVENKSNCTGCGACFNSCPTKAITMEWNNNGFYTPYINSEKCVNCGLCERICPLDKYKSQNIEQPQVFAFQNCDKEILYKCASGGAFASLANLVIEHNGTIYGVVYDDDMKVCHAKAESIEDLEKMYSSKYVQSDTKEIFAQAKADLDNGKTVLFSGTPCQIAGLKSFLRKDYEKLLTVDLVCHGVPSPKVFEMYKKEYIKQQLQSLNFRDKSRGWNPYCVSIETKQKHIDWAYKNSFVKLFLSDLITNSACYTCQFNKLPRIADLSLGDFWGVDKYDQSMNNNKGLSIILLNSEKGQYWFNQIKKQGLCKEIPLDFVIKNNPNICGSSKPHAKRKDLFEGINNGKSLKVCVKKYCKTPIHIFIYRLLPQFVKDFIKYNILKMEKEC